MVIDVDFGLFARANCKAIYITLRPIKTSPPDHPASNNGSASFFGKGSVAPGSSPNLSKALLNVKVGKKREMEEMEIDEEDKTTKKSKVAVVLNNDLLAGLSEQPCEEQ
jgi:hypothetical protein